MTKYPGPMLRYPGSKKKAADELLFYAPKRITEYREPFVGGNNFLAKIRNRCDSIWLNDLDPWVFKFHVWMRDADDCIERIMVRREECLAASAVSDDRARELFNSAVDRMRNGYDPLDYLTLNRWSMNAIVGVREQTIASFSRAGTNNGWNPITDSRATAYKKMLQGVKITNVDYAEVLDEPGTGIYAIVDPPYLLKDKIYAHAFNQEDFDRFGECLNGCKHDWMLTTGNDATSWALFGHHKVWIRYYKGSMTPKCNGIKTELIIRKR